MRNVLICAAAMLAVTGCETGIDVPVSIPAQYQGAAQLRNIAVIDFQGRDGGAFAGALEAELSNAAFNGASYFNVLNRQTLQTRSGVGGSSDAAVAAAIDYGAQLGVDAVYFGEVSGFDVEQSSERVEKSKCVEYDGIFDCEKREKYTTTCYTLAAFYTVVPKVADVRSGQVVYSDTVTGSSDAYFCDEDTTKVSSDQLLTEARSDTLSQIRNAVAPRNARAKVDLAEAASLPDRSDQAEFDGAVAFAKEGRLDRACGTWEVLLDRYPTTFELLYNTAVCAEVSGDFSRAFDIYSQIDAGLVSPNTKVSDALSRVQSQLRAQRLTPN